jgi:hypothetical protein
VQNGTEFFVGGMFENNEENVKITDRGVGIKVRGKEKMIKKDSQKIYHSALNKFTTLR